MQTLDHETSDDGRERKAKVSRARKAVLGLMALGVIAAIAGAGTFASFTASTTNDASVKTGRIILSDKVESGDLCFSDGTAPNSGHDQANLDTNVDDGCASLFTATQNPGDAAVSKKVTIKNEGSLDSELNLFAVSPGCTNSNNTDSGYAGPFGTGLPCTKVVASIQEYDSTFTTPTNSCVFPASNSSPCAALGNSSTSYLSTIGVGYSAALDLGALNNGSSRYYKVNVYLPNTGVNATTGIGNDNALQQRKATISLRWTAVQTAAP